MQTGLLRHSVVTADAPSFPSFFVFPLALVPLFERNSHRFRRLGNDYDRLKTLTHMQNSVNTHLSQLPIHCTINQSPKEETILGCRSSGDRKLGSPHTRSSAAADQSFEVYKCATSATHDVWEKWTWRRCSCSAMSITDMTGRLDVVAVFSKITVKHFLHVICSLVNPSATGANACQMFVLKFLCSSRHMKICEFSLK